MATHRFLPAVLTISMITSIGVMGNAQAATINIINGDAPGEGFNDPSPADSASTLGGNNGATLGDQRLNAFVYAANIWSSILISPVPINVFATMDPLFCDASGAVLGAAGPKSLHRNFPELPEPDTWYGQALANSLRGRDLNPAVPDITAIFNSALGTTCPTLINWYYGLDSKTPAGTVDFVYVVLHEITHGLGFFHTLDAETGRRVFLDGDDIFMKHLEDHSTGVLFPDMTDMERAEAIRNTGNLHWIGSNAVAASGFLQDGRHLSGHIEMYAPNPTQPGSAIAHFSNELTPNDLMKPFITSGHAPGLAAPLLEDLGWRLNPVPAIRGNGLYTALTINEDTLLDVDLSLTPGIRALQEADSWIAALTPVGLFWLTSDSVWVKSNEPIPFNRGPLVTVPSFNLFTGRGLMPGETTVYFGVDLVPNGTVDPNQLFATTLQIKVNPTFIP